MSESMHHLRPFAGQPSACLPGCVEPHDDGEPPLCTVEVGAVPWPRLAPDEWTVLRVGLVRDSLDGRVRVSLLAACELDDLAAAPPEAARRLAWLQLAAADRADRRN